MQALVYTGAKTLSYQAADDPKPAQGEVLVKVTAAGICGSDMHAFLGHDSRRVPPLILGHEIAGTVMSGKLEGRDVVVPPIISCHNCPYCLEGRANLCPERTMLGMNRAGGFAEFVTAPAKNLLFTGNLDLKKAALSEPTATVIHALRLIQKSLWRPLPEAKTLVIGGGAIGMLATLLLKSFGVQDLSLSETSDLRRRYYETMSGVEVHNPLAEELEPNTFEVVLDVVGIHATRGAAFKAVKPGGVVMHFGLGDAAGEIDVRKLTLGEISFLGSYAYTMNDMQQALKALQSGQLGELEWLETRPLSQGQEAFENLLAGKVAAPKIILLP